MPLPELLCEVAPGQWKQHPASPYKIENPGPPNCGLFDVSCMAKQAINGWFKDLTSSAAKKVFGFLRHTVFGTPDLDSAQMARVRQLWGTSQTIANTCFVLVISLAGVLLMAGQTLPGELSPKDVLPRLVAAFLAANLSLILLRHAIRFANALAATFLHSGKDNIDASVITDVLGGTIVANLATANTFVILVTLVVVLLALCVALIYVARLAITMVLIAAAPLALMFHALPMTDGLAKLWWRGIAGILAIQVCQSLVLVTAVQLLFTETKNSGSWFGVPTKADLLDLLLAACLLYVLIRIPSWVARTIWRPAQPRMLIQMVKTFFIYRTIGAIASKVTDPSRQKPTNERTGTQQPQPTGSQR